MRGKLETSTDVLFTIEKKRNQNIQSFIGNNYFFDNIGGSGDSVCNKSYKKTNILIKNT